jgi:ACS family allantoate permease-like MFS transporter
MTLTAFSIGNIVGTEIFLPKDAPDYIPGKTAIMVLLTVQLGISFLLRWINIRLNKKKREILEANRVKNGWSDEKLAKERERHAFMDLTDKQYVFAVTHAYRLVW